MARRREQLPTTRPHHRRRMPTDLPSGVALASGASVGRYEIVAPIAAGGGGSVYRARDGALGREIALKVLDERLVSKAMVARMQREAALSAKLAHPHVVKVHEAGRARGPGGEPLRFIAMALVEGGTLGEALDEHDLRGRVELLHQTAQGVAYAHSHGVIHRDLKPANVLIDTAGRAVVTDFGLARGLGDESDLTQSGVAMGTVHYMAPEQVRGEKRRIDERADVWALGVMLYEIVADALPFDGPVPAAVYKRILHDDLRFPRRVRGGVGAGLLPIARKCLEKNPRDRYPDAAAVADDLERWLQGKTPLATEGTRMGVSSLTRFGDLVGRHPKRVGALLVGAILASVVVTLAATSYARGRRADELLALLGEQRRGGKLTEALATAERMLELRDTAAGREIKDQLEAEVTRRREASTSQETTAARLSTIERALRPLEAELARLEEAQYVASADVPGALRKLRDRLDQLVDLTRDRVAGQSPRLWATIGVARQLIGKPNQAERALLRALQLAPDDAGIHAALGRVYLDLALVAITSAGDRPTLVHQSRTLSQKGLDHLRQGRQSWEARGHKEQQIATAYIALAAGNTRKVIEIADAAITRFGPSSPGAEIFWGLMGVSLREPPRRLKCLQRAVEIRPHSMLLCNALAFEHHERGRYQEAIRIYDHVLTLDPESLVGLGNRGAALRESGAPERALVDLEKIVELRPDYQLGWINLGVVYTDLARYEDAARAYARALEMNAGAPHLQFNLGNLAMRQGREAEMMQRWTRAIELRPGYAEALVNRGRAYARAGKLDEARRDLDRAVAADPEMVLARGKRAILRLQLKDIEGALEDLDRALELQPDYVEARVNRGVVRERAGQLEAALEDHTVVTRLQPRSAEAWFNRANVLRNLGRYEAAIADYTRSLRLERDERVLVNRGLSHLAAGDRAAADADYTAAIAHNPRYPAAYRYRAELRDLQQRFPEAIADYDRALELAPGAPVLLVDRALVHVRLRNWEQAKADLRGAVTKAPDYWKALFAIGVLQIAQGKKDKARQALQMAREKAPAAYHGAIDQLLKEAGG